MNLGANDVCFPCSCSSSFSISLCALPSRRYLPVPAGTTLRTSLSERLHCDPMRITKKFAGASCIGKQVFQPCDPNDPQHKDALTAAQVMGGWMGKCKKRKKEKKKKTR